MMMMTLTWLNLRLTQWDFPFSQLLEKPPRQNNKVMMFLNMMIMMTMVIDLM